LFKIGRFVVQIRSLLVAILCVGAIFPRLADATPLRYELTTAFLDSYFDYDRDTHVLSNFKIYDGPLSLGLVLTPPAISISVATADELRFTAEAIKYDAMYKYDDILEIKADFYPSKIGLYDGSYGYGGGLYIYRIGDGSLAGSSVGAMTNNNWQLRSIDVPPSIAPIPEPETYAMILAGLGLLGATAHRRKRKPAT
jgi:hypothetical protein